MEKRKKRANCKQQSERGMAIVAAMMCLLLCTGLGMAVLFNATGEAALSGGFRRNEQAFYAADAGLGVARMAIRNALNSAIQSTSASVGTTPSFGTRTTGGQTLTTFNRTQLSSILQSSSLISQSSGPIPTAKAAIASRAAGLSNAGFDVDIQLNLESVSDTSPVDVQRVTTNIWNVAVVEDIPSVTTGVTGKYRYTITSTGNNNITSGNPNRATARAIETGYIFVTLNATIEKPSSSGEYERSFSQYGTFLNRFNQSSVWAAGVFQGRVHTNDRFRYSSSNPVTYMGDVSQVGLTYDYNSTAYNVSNVQPNSSPHSGITVQGSYTTVPSPLPLPNSVYAQELAVLNSSGRPDVNFPSPNPTDPYPSPPQPTTLQLKTLLRTSGNGTPPTTGSGSSETLNNGVYLPATTVGGQPTINGGGIYVKGTVDEMTLTISGEAQVYAIRQGSSTTTVTITPPTSTSAGTTVISGSAGTTTFQGVPLDKTSPINSEHKPAVSLFVNGSINNMHGPAASSGSVAPAISKNTALTITSTGDMNVTGNITYQEPTLNPDGSAVTYPNNYTPRNVLGLFTNSGKITWTPNSSYTTANASMTVDAAMVAFNEAVLQTNPTASTGGWLSDCAACTSSTVLTLRGSRTVSTGIPNVNSKGHTTNRFFDPRFANGAVAPPFFPVTRLNNTVATSTTRTVFTSTTAVRTESNTWQRTYN